MQRRVFTVAVVFAALVAYASLSLAPERASLDPVRKAIHALPAYEVVIASHQERGSRSEDVTIRFAYQAPGWVRTEVLAGRNKGAIALYDPTTKRMRAKTSWTPPISLSPDAPIALSVRGERMDEASFAKMLKRVERYLRDGSVASGDTTAVGGRAARVLVFTVATPADHHGVATERWTVDEGTHLPLLTEQLDTTGHVVARAAFTELVADPTFPADHFTAF